MNISRVENQPAFGRTKVISETFKHLSPELRPLVESELQRNLKNIEKASKWLDLKIYVSPEAPDVLAIKIKKIFFPRSKFSVDGSMPAENVLMPQFRIFLPSFLECFKKISTSIKKADSEQQVLEKVLKELMGTPVGKTKV